MKSVTFSLQNKINSARDGTAYNTPGRIFHDRGDRDGGRLSGDADLAPAGWRPSVARRLDFDLALCLNVSLRGLFIGMRPDKVALIDPRHVACSIASSAPSARK